MKVVPPIPVTGATLTSSSVAETDHAAWSNVTTYSAGQRVIKTATHLVYESIAGSNLNNDPATSPTKWLTVGATNRWAMFDEAVGSVTSDDDEIEVVLTPGRAIKAVAVLDTDAATVRVLVEEGGDTLYDETQTRDADQTNILFLDLPEDAAATITVTMASPSAVVAVGTLIIGNIIDLGDTEAGPSIGITDFSRRVTDDFGNTVVVERGWSKRMAIKSKIDADDIDPVQVQLASLRARPCLWIGELGRDSLTIYGFMKDFSIDQPFETTGFLSLTIEGLTKSTPLAPRTVNWDDVTGDGKDDIVDAVEGGLNPDGTVKDDKVTTPAIVDNAVSEIYVATTASTIAGTGSPGESAYAVILTLSFDLDFPAWIEMRLIGVQTYAATADYGALLSFNGVYPASSYVGGISPSPNVLLAPVVYLSPDSYDVAVEWRGSENVTLEAGASVVVTVLKK